MQLVVDPRETTVNSTLEFSQISNSYRSTFNATDSEL